jgi:hypothetical protein
MRNHPHSLHEYVEQRFYGIKRVFDVREVIKAITISDDKTKIRESDAKEYICRADMGQELMMNANRERLNERNRETMKAR